MHPDLSFEQVPPFSAPLRFFLTAPWFGVAAGLLLAATGEDALASRWSSATLAVTHLLTLGFMLQVMCGALFQFLPVAVGQGIGRTKATATAVHVALTVGTLLLAAGFLNGQPVLLLAATALLLAGIGVFVLAAGMALWQAKSAATATPLLRFALSSLLVTAILGALLAAGLALPLPFPFFDLTDVHLAWGLGGWSLALLIAVSSFVVPMFQLTPAYPPWLARAGLPALLVLLLVWSLQATGFAPLWADFAARLAGFGLALMAAIFAIATLRLQSRGRRKASDATFGFFRFGMICLLVFAASSAAMLAIPALRDDPRLAPWLGVLVIPGAFSCVIMGMLYKIVPFLSWLHLQRTGAPIALLPNMRGFLSETATRRHPWLHLLALAVLAAALLFPALTRFAGLLLAASYGWLGYNLVAASLRYRRVRDRIPATVAGRES